MSENELGPIYDNPDLPIRLECDQQGKINACNYIKTWYVLKINKTDTESINYDEDQLYDLTELPPSPANNMLNPTESDIKQETELYEDVYQDFSPGLPVIFWQFLAIIL